MKVMKISHLLIAAVMLSAGSSLSHGATMLASYLDGTNTKNNYADLIDGLGTVTDISVTSGSLATSASVGSGSKPPMGSYWWTQQGYGNNSMHSVMRFSITLDDEYTLASLSHITLELGSGSNASPGGSFSFDYRVVIYSGEGENPVFTSNTATYSANNSESSFVHEMKTIDLSGFDTSRLEDKTLTFDIQVKSNNNWQSRSMAIQNINLYGTLLASIPEPSAMLSCLGGLALLTLRRRKDRRIPTA